MLYKCLPEAEIRRVMRIRMLLDYLAAFEMLLLKRSPKDFMAVLRARREFGRWKKDFKAERERIMEACMVKKYQAGLISLFFGSIMLKDISVFPICPWLMDSGKLPMVYDK